MKLEPTLHKALLAGSARVPLTSDSVASPALQNLLARVPEASRLWHSIAAADLWQRAGFAPGDGAAPTDAAAQDSAIAPRAAEQVLQLILRGIHPELLDSWLARARCAQVSLPHACLVPLIELALQRRALRSAVAPLLGERGRWLLAQHPAWSEAFAADVVQPGSWELGSLAQRVEALQALRGLDPAAALAALEADWAQEPAEHRIALLPCLSCGLGLADQAFLERALDDKRKEVRAVAQQLLGRLPGSQLRERCKARLLALLNFERPSLTLRLPQECDKAMKRDGIGLQTHYGVGEKAGWLQDMMCGVAPHFWSEHWQLTAPEVMALFTADEFRTVLLTGLAHAAGRALDADPGPAAVAWFVALIGYSAPRADLDLIHVLLPYLERLPLAEQERLVQGWLGESSGPYAFDYAMRWAEQHGALSAGLSALLLGRVQRQMFAAPLPDYGTRARFKTLAQVLDAGALAYAVAGWPPAPWEHWPEWRALADELMETLNFRHTMQTSFLENHA
jgi:hypothetical protein